MVRHGFEAPSDKLTNQITRRVINCHLYHLQKTRLITPATTNAASCVAARVVSWCLPNIKPAFISHKRGGGEGAHL